MALGRSVFAVLGATARPCRGSSGGTEAAAPLESSVTDAPEARASAGRAPPTARVSPGLPGPTGPASFTLSAAWGDIELPLGSFATFFSALGRTPPCF